MPGSTPPTSQLDWLSSTTAMIVLLWSRATRDLLKSFGWGIVALHRLNTATKLPSLRRPPHRIFSSPKDKAETLSTRNRLFESLSRPAKSHHRTSILSTGRYGPRYRRLGALTLEGDRAYDLSS